MDAALLIGLVSIVTAGLTIAIGTIGPALAEGRARLAMPPLLKR